MTPSFTPTFDDDDDMTAVYKEAIPTAELALTGAVVQVIENDANNGSTGSVTEEHRRSTVNYH